MQTDHAMVQGWFRVQYQELINKLQKYGVCLDEFTWQSFVVPRRKGKTLLLTQV